MNIIIKGIDDFNCCVDCPCFNEPYDRCNVLWDEFNNYKHSSLARDKACPIIKLKENRHYIDADRLIAFLKSVISYDDTIKNIINLIKHQPDILEVNNESND